MHKAVIRVVEDTSNLVIYTVSAIYEDHPKPRLANEDDQADFVLNIKPWYQSKLDSTICHQTQHALFVRRASKAAGRQMTLAEVTSDEESLHRAWPKGDTNVQDPLGDFLQSNCSEAILER
jgi:hypothetical protein